MDVSSAMNGFKVGVAAFGHSRTRSSQGLESFKNELVGSNGGYFEERSCAKLIGTWNNEKPLLRALPFNSTPTAALPIVPQSPHHLPFPPRRLRCCHNGTWRTPCSADSESRTQLRMCVLWRW